jgi:hypothetical protein
MTCKHETFKTIRTRCFGGPIPGSDEKRAAHGNITETDECVHCGARREENVNGRHVETGPWGPSRAQREAKEAAEARAAAVAQREAELAASNLIRAIPSRRLTSSKGDVVTASVDSEGIIVLTGYPSNRDPSPLLSALGDEWISAARAARLSYLSSTCRFVDQS